MKKLEKEIRAQIDMLAVDQPEIAKELSKKILGTNTGVDIEFAKGEIPMEEVRFYPGSAKGFAPEDDPETYSRWFMENQPPSTLDEYGNIDLDSIGAKNRFIRMVRDADSMNEIKSPSMYYFDNDEMYPMQNYHGQPEFEMFNRESFNVADTNELPQLTFMSNTWVNELPPQHNDNTLDY